MNRAVPPSLTACLVIASCAVAPAPSKPTSTAGTVTCDYRATNRPAKPVDPPSTVNVPATGTEAVTLSFPGGPVQVTLDQEAAPCTAHSFVSLAQQGFFTDTRCHRLVTGDMIFVLQCGDPSGSGSGGPGYWFDDELARTTGYPAGVVAMANSGKNTNGSQFFIVYADSMQLPANYTVFGRVDAAGLKVVNDIAAAGVTPVRGPTDGTPKADTTIVSVAVG